MVLGNCRVDFLHSICRQTNIKDINDHNLLADILVEGFLNQTCSFAYLEDSQFPSLSGKCVYMVKIFARLIKSSSCQNVLINIDVYDSEKRYEVHKEF